MRNIRQIDSVITYTATKRIPGLLLSLTLRRLLILWNAHLFEKHFFTSVLALLLFNGLKPFITIQKAVL